MKSKVEKEVTKALKARVLIANITRKFTAEDIANVFQISMVTLRRHIDPKYREVSRQASRRQTERLRNTREPRGRCQTCNKALSGHPRCKVCTMLIHATETKYKDRRKLDPTMGNMRKSLCRTHDTYSHDKIGSIEDML